MNANAKAAATAKAKAEKPSEVTRTRSPRVAWTLGIGAAVLLLILWPVMSHLRWRRLEPALHGVPAFFLGLVILLAIRGAVGWVGGIVRHGLRWLGTAAPWLGALRLGAVGISLVALFYAVEWRRGSSAWARVVTEARRQEVSLEWRSLAPAPVPAAEDLGVAPLFDPLRQAFAREHAGTAPTGIGDSTENRLGPLEPLLRWGRGMWTVDMGLPAWMRGEAEDWQPGNRRGRKADSVLAAAAKAETRTARAAAIRASLDSLAPMLDAVRDLAGRPYCRLPFDYEFALLGDATSERALLSLERLAFVRAATAVTLGHSEEALGDLRLGLQLARHARAQPGLYTQGPQAAVLAHGLQGLWEGLRVGLWKEAQIAEVQALLDALRPGDSRPAYRRFVALATAGFVEGMVPATGECSAGWSGMTEDDRRVLGWVRRVYPAGWSLQNQAAVVGAWLRSDAVAAGEGSPGRAAGFVEGWARDLRREVAGGTSDPLFPVFVVPKVVALWEDGEQQTRFAEAVVRLASLACALERHRSTAGALPDALEAMVPRCLAEIPSDPAGPGALRYRREGADGFVVYSVGPDGKDDGGRVRTEGNDSEGERRAEREADWVWVGGRSMER
jgi:hypothetical protein